MERIRDTERQRPGFIVEQYKDVKPNEVNNFRMQAALYLLERQFTEEELERINTPNGSAISDLELKDGLCFTRMRFESGTFIELYLSDTHRFRIIYDPKTQTIKTNREPRNQ